MNNQPITLNASIRDVLFGRNVKVVEPSNIYGCDIGDDSGRDHERFLSKFRRFDLQIEL